MGIGDSIGKAAENAMEDLAGTSTPTEKADVPEPTDPNSDVEVHSSLSEGSNAMEAEKEKAPGLKAGSATGPVSGNPVNPDTTDTTDTGTGSSPGSTGTGSSTDAGPTMGTGPAEDIGGGTQGGAATEGGSATESAPTTEVPRDVPGPAGLPEGDPEALRADPTEGDEDPMSSGTGRG